MILLLIFTLNDCINPRNSIIYDAIILCIKKKYKYHSHSFVKTSKAQSDDRF